MQERVLHLGQNLAKELQHLLPHAGWVLRGGDRAPVSQAARQRPPRTAPPLTAREGWCLLYQRRLLSP